MSLKKNIRQLVRVMKASCLLCSATCGFIERICQGCQADLPVNDSACFCCAQPMVTSEHIFLCGLCQQQERAFQRSVIPLLYVYPVADMLQKFKYMNMLSYGPALARILSLAIRKQYVNDTFPQAIMAMPLHTARLNERGYNQAGILARHVGNELSLPVAHRLVKRIKPTPTLIEHSAKKRHRILRGAFSVKKNSFDHIAIVDDVVTSTASVETVAKVCIRSGIRRVDIWGVARTP